MYKLDEKGNVSVIMCIAITALFAFTAYVIDIGLVYSERIQLSNAIDAAALAGALELPRHEDKAKKVAIEYLEKNDVNIEEVNITIGDDSKSISINVTREVSHLFAVVFGKDHSVINLSNKVVVAPVGMVEGGIRPFAVELFDYTYGDVIVLKENAGDGYRGNFGPVALGDTGADILEDNIMFGYRGAISIGDMIDTEPGNMVNTISAVQLYLHDDTSTYENYDRDSKRIWTLPLVNTLEVNGRGQIQVVGFAQFFVEDIGKKQGHTEITGRFLRYVAKGEIDMSAVDTGTYGIKLVD